MPEKPVPKTGMDSLTYKREYARLARRVLHYHEHSSDYSHLVGFAEKERRHFVKPREAVNRWIDRPGLKVRGDEGKKVGIGVAIAHVKEGMLWPALLAWLPTTAMTVSCALSLGSLSLPVLMVTGGFMALSGVVLRKNIERSNILRDIRSDFEAFGQSRFYDQLEKLERALPPKPKPLLQRAMERVEDTLSYGARDRARQSQQTRDMLYEQASNLKPEASPAIANSAQQIFLQVARRMAHLAHNGCSNAPNLPREQALDFAAKTTQIELLVRPPLWPRLLLNRLGQRRPLTELAPHFAAVPLAKEWFSAACCGTEARHSFAKAYEALEQRMADAPRP
jgi:hypothetical protein